MDNGKESDQNKSNLWDIVEEAQEAIIKRYPTETSIARKLALKELESIASKEATDEQRIEMIRSRYLRISETQLQQPESQFSLEQEECRIKAESGNAESQYQLGTYYFYGEGVQQNYKTSVMWFRKAASQDYSPAQDHLSWCYYFGWGVSKDENESFSWYKKAIDSVFKKQERKYDENSPLLCAIFGVRKPPTADELLEKYREITLLYKAALNETNVEAQMEIGLKYEQGDDGLPKNLIKAKKWYHKAISHGSAEAMFCLGHLIYKNGFSGDEDEAIEWFQKALDGGYQDAEDYLNEMLEAKSFKEAVGINGTKDVFFKLGTRLLHGDGLIANKCEAAKWFRKAAEQGHVKAMLSLGQCYLDSDGKGKNEIEGLKWCRKAVDNNDVDAMFYLGNYFLIGQNICENKAEGIKWLKKAAEHGHERAPFLLGRAYSQGKGVEKNDSEAFYWFKMAAKQGDSSAKRELARCYMLGQGTIKDINETISIWRELAEGKHGSLDAQYNLGLCYYIGDEIKKDYVEAIKWFKMAAEHGKRPEAIKAKFTLGLCYFFGRGVNKDYEEAVKWFREAAEQGNPEAQFKLGSCYCNGEGVVRDLAEAVKWYQKAAEKKAYGAQEALDRLKTEK